MRSFKDVGVKFGDRESRVDRQTQQIPVGVKTPVKIDTSGRSFLEMNYNLGDQVADNLRNLIQTNWGERLALYNYGANLIPLCFEYTNKEDFDNEAIVRINSSIAKWMPFVTPLFYDSTVEANEAVGAIAKVKILLIYSVPQAGINEAKIETILHVGG